MKTTKEMIKVMQSYERGEQIQFCFLDDDCIWKDVDKAPTWNWIECDYRVKPKTNYAPFETVEEFLKTQKKYGNKVTHVLTGYKFRTYVSSNEQVCAINENNYSDIQLFTFLGLFRNFRFENNIPCGKEAEDETI